MDTSIDSVLAEISADLKRIGSGGDRRGSRYATAGASPSLLDNLAAGGEVTLAPEPQQKSVSTLGGVMTKALAEGTGASGGWLVPLEVAAEVMGLLRARSAVYRLNPRVVPVHRELAITSISTGASAHYVAENAAIIPSEQTFAQVPLLVPKELAALIPVSNRLLRDAAISPAVEDVIRADLAEVMALRADLAFIAGTGSGGEPLGILNTSGLTAAPAVGSDGLSFDTLKATVAAMREQNAPMGSPAWLFHPTVLSRLETLKDTTGRYLADSGLLSFDAQGAGGSLLSYKFVTTTQMDSSKVIFGSDWSTEAWLAENESLTLDVSVDATYSADGLTWISAWQNRQSVFRAVAIHDFALRRPQLFTVLDLV